MDEQTVFKQPTYEQYLKASEFAKFRYKYGLFVTIFAAVTLVCLLVYVFLHVRELNTNGLLYVQQKYDIGTCYCSGGTIEMFNSSSIKLRSSLVNGFATP